MDIVFMGTPDFSVPSLNTLAKSSDINITGVVTQPDRKKGRGQKLKPSPVKKTARNHNLEVYQPENINQSRFINQLKELSPEVIVVVAFGQKLGKEILKLPRYGCINLHASLLPKYRGSSPIHKAIINGDTKTGVTTMYMDEGWDTGDIIYKEEVEIARDDTVGELHDNLAVKGADLLLKTLLDIKHGSAPRIEQNEDQATYAYKIDKSLGEIDWSEGAEDIYNLVRGVNPWPGAYTYLDNELLKIWRTEIVDMTSTGKAGTVVSSSGEEGLIVQTGKGKLRIKKLQLAGRKRMSAAKFLRGHQIKIGEKLG